MEYLRELKVTIVKDTNKSTTKSILEIQEDESIKEFKDRVIKEMNEIFSEEWE